MGPKSTTRPGSIFDAKGGSKFNAIQHEYNLALGQRRADSVHKFLTAKGVPDNQIETISFGKEKPRSHGHNEKSWTENRRTDIVYQGE